jgi:leucyl-tRNA synthetase
MTQWSMRISAYAERLLQGLMISTGASVSKKVKETGLENHWCDGYFKVKVKDKSKEKKEIEVLQHDLILFCVTL